jgi:predicted RNA binding protein YcfA (HicA-like mRNA interferase family)
VARGAKTLAAMRDNPRDWRIASLESVAAAAGVNVRKTGGSHVVFEHPTVVEALSVPARRPIKPIYIKRFIRFIDAVRSAHERD